MDVIPIISSIPYFVAGAFLVAWLWTSIVIVREKTAVTITRFGSYVRTMSPGLRVKMPWPIEAKDITLNLQVWQIAAEITAKTKDNAFVLIPVKVQVEVIRDKAYEAAYALDNPKDQIKSYVENVIRSTTQTLDVDDVYGNKDTFERAVTTELASNFEGYGYRVRNVLVDDPRLSTEMAKSFERVLQAGREQQAAKMEAEAIRIKFVGQATAEAESLKIKGEAFKSFRKQVAEGNSEAMAEFLKDNTDGSLNAATVLDFFAGIDERDAIREVGKNGGKVVFFAASAREQAHAAASSTAGVEAAKD